MAAMRRFPFTPSGYLEFFPANPLFSAIFVNFPDNLIFGITICGKPENNRY